MLCLVAIFVILTYMLSFSCHCVISAWGKFSQYMQNHKKRENYPHVKISMFIVNAHLIAIKGEKQNFFQYNFKGNQLFTIQM